MLLTTERLVLREFIEGDWEAVLAYQQNPLYLRYYAWHKRKPEAVREFVHRFIVQQRDIPRVKYQLAVTLNGTGHLIGNCGIRLNSADAQEAEIGYELAPHYWGQGYATEAAEAVVRFGFSYLKLHRISAWCIAENSASARVLDRLGMRQEGRLREKEYFKGQWWDVLVYGILVHEWQEQERSRSCQ